MLDPAWRRTTLTVTPIAGGSRRGFRSSRICAARRLGSCIRPFANDQGLEALIAVVHAHDQIVRRNEYRRWGKDQGLD